MSRMVIIYDSSKDDDIKYPSVQIIPVEEALNRIIFPYEKPAIHDGLPVKTVL